MVGTCLRKMQDADLGKAQSRPEGAEARRAGLTRGPRLLCLQEVGPVHCAAQAGLGRGRPRT